jgi:hypothetical protein
MMKRKSHRLLIGVGGFLLFVVLDLLGSSSKRTPRGGVDALVRDCFSVTNNNNTSTTTTTTTAIITEGLPTKAGCYSSLADVAVAMEDKNPFMVETYILCPDTIYTIGDRDPHRPDCYLNGDVAVQLRQFSTIQCGANGSSLNNCTIRGGYNQMATTAGSYELEDKVGIVVQGITFAQGRGGALFLAAGGDIVFRDCIFKVKQLESMEPNLNGVSNDSSVILFLFLLLFHYNNYAGRITLTTERSRWSSRHLTSMGTNAVFCNSHNENHPNRLR